MQSAINRFIKKLFDAVWSFGALQGVWIFWEQNIEDNKILIRYYSPLSIAKPKNSYLRCATKTRICPIFPGIHMIRNIVATITCTLNAGKLCSNQWCGTLSMYSGSLSSKYVRSVLFEDNSDISYKTYDHKPYVKNEKSQARLSQYRNNFKII